jgi:DNA-binding HxlR family transcriptional regulator
MSKHGENEKTLCPVARSTDLIGDRWTILVMRELTIGPSRFQDLQAQTGATAQMLTARLKSMESDGLVERRAYSQRPLRHEYLLTRKGQEFFPILLAFRAWGEKWCKESTEGLAVRMTHRSCGTELKLDGVCPKCRERVGWREIEAHPMPRYLDERRQRDVSFRAALQGS